MKRIFVIIVLSPLTIPAALSVGLFIMVCYLTTLAMENILEMDGDL